MYQIQITMIYIRKELEKNPITKLTGYYAISKIKKYVRTLKIP